jgi:acyl phosphate:glycerol-3-phosphate acyltransferase
MNAILWTAIGFLLGSIPFSVILGRVLLGKDIRQYGDGNPGGTNVGRASGNKLLGALAIAIDMAKGALPVALAYYVFGVNGWGLTAVMLAPILGHAYSPFLRWKGGKAIAVTFGVWTTLTVPFGPFVMAFSLLALTRLVSAAGWAVMGALLVLLALLAVLGLVTPPVLAAWLGTSIILASKHWADLTRRPRLRFMKRQDAPRNASEG